MQIAAKVGGIRQRIDRVAGSNTGAPARLELPTKLTGKFIHPNSRHQTSAIANATGETEPHRASFAVERITCSGSRGPRVTLKRKLYNLLSYEQLFAEKASRILGPDKHIQTGSRRNLELVKELGA